MVDQQLVGVAVVPAQAVPALCGGQVGPVHVHRCVRQPVQPGHVVFVHMAQDHQVYVVQRRADVVGDRRRVEGHARVTAVHDDLVAVGVLAGLFAEVDGHRAELPHGAGAV